MAVRLPGGVWHFSPDDRLGPEGGFGAVFAGIDANGQVVAVKRLHAEVGELAHREMRIAKELTSRELANVLPILDAGQDADSDYYYVIMPRADHSLQDEIDKDCTWDSPGSASILLSIAKGLGEVDDLVHRDLKPANILLHEGVWKIADFGIAKFVEASTSRHTLRECLSPQYAAPEQWRNERSTHATDIYALGCIGYALITGRPPFDGTSDEELHRQHVSEVVRLPDRLDPKFRSLLVMMLRKVADTRPRLDRVVAVLQQVVESQEKPQSGAGFGALAKAGADVVVEQAAKEAEAQTLAQRQQQRSDLARAGFEILEDLIDDLISRICHEVPTANRYDKKGVRIGDRATLRVTHNEDARYPLDPLPQSKWDIVAGAKIGVGQLYPRFERESSLFYAELPGARRGGRRFGR